nr:phosphoribosyltransferase domain-containing protein [Deinobacterium chartae]
MCGFATRRNPKRGFLFVSRVLGKHLPVRPSRMLAVHRRLAAALEAELPGPLLFVAMAETAVGLGQGVFEAYLEATGREDALFVHSTRYRVGTGATLGFQEAHSHATDHLLHLPEDAAQRALFDRARTLVLLDDEMTTGNTLAGLSAAYAAHNPGLEQIRVATLTDWSLGAAESLEVRLPRPSRRVSLLEGRYTFEPDPAFVLPAMPRLDGSGERKDTRLRGNWGRLGQSGPVRVDVDALLAPLRDLEARQRVLVLGSGEFAHPPYRLALALEERGLDVHFQSTTRSPILPGGVIQCALEFEDNYFDRIPNYVYNLRPGDYDRVLIGYETPELPAGHDLPARLGAEPLFF